MRQLFSPTPAMGWAWFDFANSSYVLIFQTFLLPVFFINVLGSTDQLASWGFIAGASTGLGALLAIIIGKYTDGRNRLDAFKLLAWGAFLGMISVAYCVAINPQWVPTVYLITNTMFIALLGLSDSFLPFLTRSSTKSFVTSGRAWGFGYLGGIVALITVLWLQQKFGEFTPWSFAGVALFFLAFVVLACRGLQRIDWQTPLANPGEEDRHAARISPQQRGVILVGAWLIAECVAIAILFFSIYASSELGLASSDIGATLLLVQLVAFPATWWGGRLPEKFSGLRLLGMTIPVWFVAIALLILWVESVQQLWVVAILCGLVLGNTQSYLRALYSNITPRARAGYHFGFYIFTTQAAAFVGTWLYGSLSAALGSQQLPMAIIALLMVLGFALVALGYRSTAVK